MFDVTTFVRARRAFDQGRGPDDAWGCLHVLSIERLRALAERDGARSWAMLVGPLDTLADADEQATLVHTLRSMGYGHVRCRIYWRNPSTVVCSSAMVVPRLSDHQATRIALRRHQVAVVQVTTEPEQLEAVDVATGRRVGREAIGAEAIAGALGELFDAARVLVEYVPASWLEGVACSLAERRLR